MSRIVRNAILALTAIAALGAVSVTSSTKAEAGHKHWHKPWHKPHWKPWHKPHWHGHGRRPHVIYAAPVVVGAAYAARPAARPAPAKPNPSACLTKEYTPEGQVVFKDLCTNEVAVAPVQGAQNFAGRTFQDFQGTQPNAPAAQQSPAAQTAPQPAPQPAQQ